MKRRIETISHGPSFSGFYHGIGMLGGSISIILFFMHTWFLIPMVLLIISIVLLLSIRMVQIDYANKDIRDVLYLFPFKIGKWEPISNYDLLVLAANHSTSRTFQPIAPLMQRSSTIRAYDVYLTSSTHPEKKQLITSSFTIPMAQKSLGVYARRLSMEENDLIKMTWDKYRNKRRLRRRR